MKIIDKLTCPVDYDCYDCSHYQAWQSKCKFKHKLKRIDGIKDKIIYGQNPNKLCEDYKLDEIFI